MKKLYGQMPWPIQQLGVAAQGAYNRALRYGRRFQEQLRLFERSSRWSEDELAEYQRATLCELLDEAATHTEYYAARLAGWNGKGRRSASEAPDLPVLPLLDKETVRNHGRSLLNGSRSTVTVSTTSGSTGSPMAAEYDRHSIELRWAIMRGHRTWSGLGPFARSVHFSGRQIVAGSRFRPPFWMYNPFERQLLVSTYHLRADHMEDILRAIRSFEPEVFTGYSSAMAQVAASAADRGLRFSSLRAAYTTAETLGEETRRTITEGLGLRVFDFYSGSEGVPFILECEAGRMHICPVSGIFELLDGDGNPVGPGEMGELVATSFVQWRMPLIRYRTGDWAVAPEDSTPCDCGRRWPHVERILGRVEDLIATRDGRKLGMFSYRTMKHVQGVVASQIIQNDYDRFLVKAVLDGTVAEEAVRDSIQRIFSDVIGYPVHVTLRAVLEIEKGASGKIRSSINNIPATLEAR
jgi:phenylacetate-CoA ligase